MTVTPIKKPFAPEEIPATLRVIAGEIEAGKHGLKTTCVVVLGHTWERPGDDGGKLLCDEFDIFGLGPRTDPFTVRGLLLTAATRPIRGEDSEPEIPA